ncbi:hypothetical protein H4Q26_000921 [Puccinia striiformis f. sp. tritici PST-130]|nr:hypothetical protein H4Q26_000921 [Puccinia striiformis f. sp. tritici PST-130]
MISKFWAANSSRSTSLSTGPSLGLTDSHWCVIDFYRINLSPIMTDQTPQKNRSNISDSSLSQSDPEERSRRLYTSDRDHQDFISFCRRAGLSTALRYLELFEEVFEILSADHPVTRSWLINFATGKALPSTLRQQKIDLAAKNRSLECASDVGERILRNTVQPPVFARDAVEKGFTSDYVGHDNIVASTIKTLEAWSSAWFRETYFAPYTCLVGPTMIGKSRLPKELAKEVCVIYICLRPVGSTGEPPRSQFATEMLARQYSEEHYDRLIAAVLSVAIVFRGIQFKSRDLVGSNDTPSDLGRAAQSICENEFFKSTQLKVVLAIDEASALLELTPNEDVTRFQKFAVL